MGFRMLLELLKLQRSKEVCFGDWAVLRRWLAARLEVTPAGVLANEGNLIATIWNCDSEGKGVSRRRLETDVSYALDDNL
ncbi:hypothetical protein Lal_00031324 [Lupinus albus]|nr:hypothetical protein Lal_00031324 [Lupinus albus]